VDMCQKPLDALREAGNTFEHSRNSLSGIFECVEILNPNFF